MEGEYESSGDEADAMSRFMGFSAFGSQGPAKKRKFNASTDAVVEGQELVALDKGGRKGQGSGGNDIPLGKQRVFGQTTAAVVSRTNQEEIDLDLDEDEEGDVDEVSARRPVVNVDGDDEGEDRDGPKYMDTSMPAPAQTTSRPSNHDEGVKKEEEEARAAQAKIDHILLETSNTSTTSRPEQEKLPSRNKKTKAQNQGLAAYMSALKDSPLPPPPPPSSAPAPPSIPQQSFKPSTTQPPNHQQNRGQKGQRNELWYVGYYDTNFNENPWAQLEKNKGLLPVGSWLERSTRT